MVLYKGLFRGVKDLQCIVPLAMSKSLAFGRTVVAVSVGFRRGLATEKIRPYIASWAWVRRPTELAVEC